MTTSEILTKIEAALGYVEMGKKGIDERVNAILAEIGEIENPHLAETMTRDEAASTIEALYPTDSEYPDTNKVGADLLAEAQRLVAKVRTWRDEPTEVLVKYAELCGKYEGQQYKGHSALMPDLSKL